MAVDNKLKTSWMLFLLGLAILIISGCAAAIPRAPLLFPQTQERIPLHIGLYFPKEFQTARFKTVLPGEHPLEKNVEVDIGRSSINLFLQGTAQVFSEVTKAENPNSTSQYDLILSPSIVNASGVKDKDDVKATIEYQVELIDQKGGRSSLRSGLHNGVYNPEKEIERARPKSFFEIFLFILILPIALLIVLPSVLLGPTSIATSYFSHAFAQAEAQAFADLVGQLRSSPAIMVALEEKEFARVTKDDPATFEERLSSLAQDLITSLPKERPRKIAVAEFKPVVGSPTEFEKYLTEELITRLAQTKPHILVERTLLDKALSELKLQKSDLVDPRHAKDIGRFTGADTVLVGTTANMKFKMKINVRLVETETGAILSAAEATVFKHEQIRRLLGELPK